MALSDVVRKAVAIADRVTSSLQAEVTHEPWIGKDKYGKPLFDNPVRRMAIIDRRMSSIGGQQIVTSATVSFLYPITPNGATGRQEPIDVRDKITLPNGWTQPIVGVNGMIDPLTGMPYLYEVSLGPSGGA